MRLHKKAGGIPYGVALAAGGLWLYPSTPWLQSLAV
jgi:Flp pilus assembly protein protease CpaA